MQVSPHKFKKFTPECECCFIAILQLQRLALWFLIYTEAANLRHMPECLWWLFWVLSANLPDPEVGTAFQPPVWVQCANLSSHACCTFIGASML